jgi:cell division protein FtsB
MYRSLITVSLILVFGSCAVMSVLGLISVFPDKKAIVFCLGSGMELGKILAISHLYRNWKQSALIEKISFTSIICFLTTVTFILGFGFLSQSHQKSIHQSQKILAQINALEHEMSLLDKEIDTIFSTINGYPDSYVAKKTQALEKSNYQQNINRKHEIIKTRAKLELELLSQKSNSSPVFAVARIINIDESQIIRLFIIVLVIVLEPLTIGLTIATNAAWLNTEKTKTEHTQPQKAIPSINDNTEKLQCIAQEHQLTPSQIAEITGRKKIKTCKAWLKGDIPTPPRALYEIESWVEKQKNRPPSKKKSIELVK